MTEYQLKWFGFYCLAVTVAIIISYILVLLTEEKSKL